MIRKTGTSMKRTRIKNTSIEIPQVVFGTSAFGNLYQQTTDECRLAITKEIMVHTSGVVAFDSAGKYGAGLALEKLGETLGKLNVPRERVLISNKLGWRRVPLETAEPTFEPGVWFGIEHDAVQDISYDGILRCWEEGMPIERWENCVLLDWRRRSVLGPKTGEFRNDWLSVAISIGSCLPTVLPSTVTNLSC